MSARTSLNFPNNLTQVFINTSTLGAATLIAGAPGKSIKVFRMKIWVGAATTLSFMDGSSTILDDQVWPAPGAMILDFTTIDMPPWYETSFGNDLVLNNSAGAVVSGNVDYLLS